MVLTPKPSTPPVLSIKFYWHMTMPTWSSFHVSRWSPAAFQTQL